MHHVRRFIVPQCAGTSKEGMDFFSQMDSRRVDNREGISAEWKERKLLFC
jgi:hypothetical protein